MEIYAQENNKYCVLSQKGGASQSGTLLFREHIAL